MRWEDNRSCRVDKDLKRGCPNLLEANFCVVLQYICKPSWGKAFESIEGQHKNLGFY
jgi:hypothetical protein